MPPSSPSSAPSRQAGSVAVVAPAPCAAGRDTPGDVCDREYRQEVFTWWREVALALFCIVGSLLIAAIVLSPLLIGLSV